jgi:uncharacterized protein (TIGR02646 family)
MHKLNRGTAPGCLARYQCGRKTWEDVVETDKEEIRTELKSMQCELCAYCECSLIDHGQHIEHLRQRSIYPQGAFDWQNLFASCNRKNSCGKHKDSIPRTYDHRDLIKPDVEDPEYFYHFMVDGTISLRPGLSAAEQKRATETLRIFNLDQTHGSLRAMRHEAGVGYEETGLAVAELFEAGAPAADCLAFIIEELAYTSSLPFRTVIRHTLLPADMHLTTP